MPIRLGIDGTDDVWGEFTYSMNGIALHLTIFPGILLRAVLSENMFASADNMTFEAA